MLVFWLVFDENFLKPVMYGLKINFLNTLVGYVNADGAVNNLNEYMEISGRDVVAKLEAEAVTSVYTQSLGLVIGENQLEEFFSKMNANAGAPLI